MKLMNISLLVLVLFAGCSNNPVGPERISILKEESTIAYVESIHVLVPKVCIESNFTDIQSINPFFINFNVKGDLKTMIDGDSNATIDSRNLNFSTLSKGKELFCTGINLKLVRGVEKTVLEKLIQDGNIAVTITEPNGDVITRMPLVELVIGEHDGSVVES